MDCSIDHVHRGVTTTLDTRLDICLLFSHTLLYVSFLTCHTFAASFSEKYIFNSNTKIKLIVTGILRNDVGTPGTIVARRPEAHAV